MSFQIPILNIFLNSFHKVELLSLTFEVDRHILQSASSTRTTFCVDTNSRQPDSRSRLRNGERGDARVVEWTLRGVVRERPAHGHSRRCARQRSFERDHPQARNLRHQQTNTEQTNLAVISRERSLPFWFGKTLRWCMCLFVWQFCCNVGFILTIFFLGLEDKDFVFLVTMTSLVALVSIYFYFL